MSDYDRKLHWWRMGFKEHRVILFAIDYAHATKVWLNDLDTRLVKF